MRITERCGCGASIEAKSSNGREALDVVTTWRFDHGHDCRCPATPRSDEQGAAGVMPCTVAPESERA